MRALVASLILNLSQNGWISDSVPLKLPFTPGDIEELCLRDTCDVFYSLIRLVPSKVSVYCIVDGISYYERDLWREDFSLMMTCFGSIIDDETLESYFKLLLTSPTRSVTLCDLLLHQRVSLRGARARARA